MIKNTFVKLSLSQITASISSMLCLLIDSIMIGRLLGVQAMSSYGLASPLIIIFAGIMLMIVCGTQMTVATAVGKGDLDEISKCYSTSLIISLSISVLVTLLIYTAAHPICILLGAEKANVPVEVKEMTIQYLKGYFIGSPFIFLSQLMMPYLQTMGRRKEILTSVLCMTASDIVFNIISIYVFHAGIFGIGVASGLSYLVAFLTVGGYFLKKECIFKFIFRNISPDTAYKIIKAGSPLLLVQACYVARVYSFNQLFLFLGGTDAVAVFSIVTVPAEVLYRIGLGSAEVTLTMSSLLYGDEDRGGLIELIKAMFIYTLIYISAAVLFVCAAAPWIISIYVPHDFALFDSGVTALRLFAVSFIPACISCVFEKYYLGTRQTGLVNISSVCEGLILTASFAWIFGLCFGLDGVWIGVNVGQIATLLVISLFIWRKAGKISFSPETYSYLDKDFGVDQDNITNLSVSDIETAESASEKIYEFYLKRGNGKREAMLISLCAEEIAINIIEHGFKADNRKHSMEIRTVQKDDRITLRFRDDCVSFDPTEYVAMNNMDNGVEHIGLRMIMKMVDDAVYINSLGLNNLMLSIKVVMNYE